VIVEIAFVAHQATRTVALLHPATTRLIVADFTGQSVNVGLEVGWAMGELISVIASQSMGTQFSSVVSPRPTMPARASGLGSRGVAGTSTLGSWSTSHRPSPAPTTSVCPSAVPTGAPGDQVHTRTRHAGRTLSTERGNGM
jgi:hypothetical protein